MHCNVAKTEKLSNVVEAAAVETELQSFGKQQRCHFLSIVRHVVCPMEDFKCLHILTKLSKASCKLWGEVLEKTMVFTLRLERNRPQLGLNPSPGAAP